MNGYLAGEDRDRAEDFAQAWVDPAFQDVIAARGGFGVTLPAPFTLGPYGRMTSAVAVTMRIATLRIHSHSG